MVAVLEHRFPVYVSKPELRERAAEPPGTKAASRPIRSQRTPQNPKREESSASGASSKTTPEALG